MELLKPYYPLLVCNAQQLSEKTALPDDGYGLALELDMQGGPQPVSGIDDLIRSNRPFLLLIPQQSHLIDTGLLDIVILCLFGKDYIKPGGHPVIAFLHNEGTDTEVTDNLFSEFIVSKLKGQGWSSILCWHLSSVPFDQQLAANRPVPLVVDRLNFDVDFLEHSFLPLFHYSTNYIFFKAPTLPEAQALEQGFWRLCKPVLQRNHALQEGLQNLISTRDKAQVLQVKASMLEERLQNAEQTISVIRSKYKDDYEQLFKWYHNEYEVLPLWYKRFGHILKVLMGKRTFKSLFYDHVKKYKS